MSAGIRRGLYAITPPSPHPPGALESVVAAAIEGGAVMIQYRDKSSDHARRAQECSSLKTICGASGVPLIVNDDVELALKTGADGVHVGREDATLGDARQRLGPGAIIGVSCYASIERAAAAEGDGADYVAFGSFFPSATKPYAPLCPLSVLNDARDSLKAPLAAIGGITAENGGALVAAGADLLAVIDGVFGQPDVRIAAERFAALFR